MSRLSDSQHLFLEAGAVFVVATGFLIILAPSVPFTKELGVCESGAVRDVLAGNIILPRFLPGPIVHVPPLYWWTAALCVKAFGWNELALRLPSLIAAALTCAIVFAWTSATIGRRAGLWSAAALLLCHFFLDAARQPRMDSMLALFVTAAAASLERAIAVRPLARGRDQRSRAHQWSEAKPADESASCVRNKDSATCVPRIDARATWYFAAAAAAIGLGALTKGILGIALPGLVMVLFLLVRGRFGELFRFDAVATFAVGLAIGMGWFIAAYDLGGRAFLDWQVRMNLWSRFIPAGAGGAGYCAHPFWYFAPQILSGFLPWSLYLPVFALTAWPRAERRLPEAIVYTLCWFAALFIFFSSAQGKCLIYILPAFPPLAILAGWAIAEAQTGLAARKWIGPLFSAGSAIIAIGAAVMVTAVVAVIGYGLPAKMPLRLHPTDRRFLGILLGQAFSPSLIIWVILSLAGIGLVLTGLLRRDPIDSDAHGFLNAARRLACSVHFVHLLADSFARFASEGSASVLQASGTLVIAAAGGWFWFAVMNPALARRETLKTFAGEVAAIVPADARIGHIGLGDCELNFYSPRPLEPLSHFSCAEDPAVRQYIVIRKQDFDAMAAERRSCFTIVLEAIPDDSIGPRLLLKQRPVLH